METQLLVFCNLPNDQSGSPMVLRNTIEALKAYSDCILFVGSDGAGVLDEVGIQTSRYRYRRSRNKFITLGSYLVSQVDLYFSLSRRKEISSDAIVFVNALMPFGGMIWARWNKRRLIVHVHEVTITPLPLRWFLMKCAAVCADQLIYVSKDHLARLPIAGPRAEVVYNTVSQSIWTAANRSTYLPRRSGAFEVLMLSSLRGYKGIDAFFALAMNFEARTDIHFTLVLNANIEEVSSLRATHSAAENVTIHARAKDTTKFYTQADLVLNLSLPDQWIETFGLTIVEAMSFGVPVIVPPVGGPSEIVSHAIEGFCIDSRDVPALMKAVQDLADNQKLAEKMSRAARRRANDFTFEAYKRQIQRLVEEVKKNPLPL